VIIKGKLRWFERKDDTDWIKRYTAIQLIIQAAETRQK